MAILPDQLFQLPSIICQWYTRSAELNIVDTHVYRGNDNFQLDRHTLVYIFGEHVTSAIAIHFSFSRPFFCWIVSDRDRRSAFIPLI